MREYVTYAVVLGVRPVGEHDRIVSFFTKDFGRIEGRVVAGRKPLSKFASHCDILNLVMLRLVKKRNFTVTDIRTEDRFMRVRGHVPVLARALDLFFLLRALLSRGEADPRVWHALIRALNESKFEPRLFLKMLGYDPLHASCAVCGKRAIRAFSPQGQEFFCVSCARLIPQNEIVLI